MQIHQQHYRLDRLYRANVRDASGNLLYQSEMHRRWNDARDEAQAWIDKQLEESVRELSEAGIPDTPARRTKESML